MKSIPQKILREMKKYCDFKQRVWKECFNIAAGRTITYGELAKRIKCQGAARAVGAALAKNPFAPIIPCHRVIRKDGRLGGYSAKGGLKLKDKILKFERDTQKDYKGKLK